MQIHINPLASILLFSICIFLACRNPRNNNGAKANKDSLSGNIIIQAKKADSAKSKKINFSKLYGNWLQYDTEFSGKFTDVKSLLKDTARLINKVEEYRKHGGCDGGCIFASKFTKDGILQKRIDDYGEVYSVKIDSGNNTITVLTHTFKGEKVPADTAWAMEITYLDDNFLLEYYPGKKGKYGRTEMLKRISWDFR